MSGRLGQRLMRVLHRERNVTGLGSKSPKRLPLDVDHIQVDPLRSKAREAFALPDVGAVVHLGVTHDPRARVVQTESSNLRAFQKVLQYVERFKIPKVILLSSANAYGPRPQNAQFLDESAPLLASGRFTEMRALVELDMYAQSFFWRHPETELVILRPTNILGTVQNAPSNYLRLQVVPTLMGFDPMIQVLHQDDLVKAIQLSLKSGVKGVYNIAGPKAVPLSKMLDILQRARVPLPYTMVKGGLSSLFRLGLSKYAAPELDFIRYVCMVDDAAARNDLGYAPTHDLLSTLKSVDQERWVSRRVVS